MRPLKLRQVRPPRSIYPFQQHLARLIHEDALGCVDDHRMKYANAHQPSQRPQR